jgi:thiamine phosphate synthase YjbQ (UPF0047 family)
MKSHTAYLTMHLPTTTGFVNITPQVDEAVRESGVREGLVLVKMTHVAQRPQSPASPGG